MVTGAAAVRPWQGAGRQDGALHLVCARRKPTNRVLCRPARSRVEFDAKGQRGRSDDRPFGILTCDPAAEVKAIHPKAMPVILTSAEEIDIWLSVAWEEVATVRGPLQDGALRIVAVGQKKDEAL